MTQEEIYGQLLPIFREVLEDPSLAISDDTSPADVEAWTSFAQINLIVEIEGRFQIRIHSGELQDLRSVGDFVRLISAKTASQVTKAATR